MTARSDVLPGRRHSSFVRSALCFLVTVCLAFASAVLLLPMVAMALAEVLLGG